MDIEWLRSACLALPGTTEGVKWDNDLCFMVAEKYRAILSIDQIEIAKKGPGNPGKKSKK